MYVWFVNSKREIRKKWFMIQRFFSNISPKKTTSLGAANKVLTEISVLFATFTLLIVAYPNRLLMLHLPQLKVLLSTPQQVVITTHHKPDGDALGSSLGLAGYLRKKGHTVTVVTPSDYPAFLNWMPGRSEVVEYSDRTHQAVAKLVEEATLIFCLDFNTLGRIYDMEPMVRQATAPKVMIDHHLQPDDFATYVYSVPTAAATAELIYNFIDLMGDAALLDAPIGECLYAGLLTDTGSFKYAATTPAVHRIAAAIKELGVDTTRIHRLIYDNTSLDKLRLLGYVLSEKLVVLPEYRVAYVALSKEELRKYNAQTGDTEGLVNYALSVQGIVMAVLITERPDMVKMSFRSINHFDVSALARKYFSGGGHHNAAGGRSNESLNATIQRLIALLPEYQTELLNNA
jgi:bifunctional oligoribonuclease and PAP phosphatase NrnA